MKKEQKDNTNNINLFFNSSLQEALTSLKSEIPEKKMEKLLTVFRSQNDYINDLFGKMRKILVVDSIPT